MKFTILTSFFLVSISSAIALAAHLEARDVFVPTILYPNSGTIWKVGEKHNVTWDMTDAPANINNGNNKIMLSKGGSSTHLILADKFDILLGRVLVTVPWMEDGDDYKLIVYRNSVHFTITGA